MKSLISAVCVLLIITAFIVFSAIYISNFCSELLDMAKKLPSSEIEGSLTNFSDFSDIYSKIYEYWNKKKGYIRMTVGHIDAEDIDDALEEISVRYTNNDSAGYMYARRRFISLVEELKLAEMPTWYALG